MELTVVFERHFEAIDPVTSGSISQICLLLLTMPMWIDIRREGR